MVAKYGKPASRRFRGSAGTPKSFNVSLAHHGVTSVTFHHMPKPWAMNDGYVGDEHQPEVNRG
jgi:hypothetical protein